MYPEMSLWTALLTLLIIVVVFLVLILISRLIWLWFFRINEIVDNLKHANTLLLRINDGIKSLNDKSDTIKAIGDPGIKNLNRAQMQRMSTTASVEKEGLFSDRHHEPLENKVIDRDAVVLFLKGTDTNAKLTMRLIPSGEFTMGSTAEEEGRKEDETQQVVTIKYPYYMGICPITQAQWKAVMETTSSTFIGDSSLPVESVSWEDCQKFIARINAMGIGTFRLPTEAEWEYACRAGSTTRFPWGDDTDYSLIGQYAWYGESATTGTTYFVGQKKPNAWGLYDMHGNVSEWCSDWYAASYDVDKVTDPTGPATGSNRVKRGGSWSSIPNYCRSAFRDFSAPTSKHSNVGFRLVREY